MSDADPDMAVKINNFKFSDMNRSPAVSKMRLHPIPHTNANSKAMTVALYGGSDVKSTAAIEVAVPTGSDTVTEKLTYVAATTTPVAVGTLLWKDAGYVAFAAGSATTGLAWGKTCI